LGATGLQSEFEKECTVLDSPREIAKGMAAIFNYRKKTDAEGFFTGLASGFMDIPEDMWLLTKNYLDSDNRWRNQTDTIRLLSLLKKGITSEDMRKVITTVIKKYVSGLSEDQCRHLLIKMAGQQLGAIGFKMAFVNQIISLFASQVIPKFLVSAGLTGILSVGASVSRSIYKSYELKELDLDVYNMLRGMGDLDLLYFMLEDNAKPFLQAIKYQKTNDEIGNKIFNDFISEVKGV